METEEKYTLDDIYEVEHKKIHCVKNITIKRFIRYEQKTYGFR